MLFVFSFVRVSFVRVVVSLVVVRPVPPKQTKGSCSAVPVVCCWHPQSFESENMSGDPKTTNLGQSLLGEVENVQLIHLENGGDELGKTSAPQGQASSGTGAAAAPGGEAVKQVLKDLDARDGTVVEVVATECGAPQRAGSQNLLCPRPGVVEANVDGTVRLLCKAHVANPPTFALSTGFYMVGDEVLDINNEPSREQFIALDITPSDAAYVLDSRMEVSKELRARLLVLAGRATCSSKTASSTSSTSTSTSTKAVANAARRTGKGLDVGLQDILSGGAMG